MILMGFEASIIRSAFRSVNHNTDAVGVLAVLTVESKRSSKKSNNSGTNILKRVLAGFHFPCELCKLRLLSRPKRNGGRRQME